MKQSSLLAYRGYRFLKLALLVALLAVVPYAWHTPSPKPYGGTWLGYLLGTVSVILILWLTAYGIRKRRYQSTLGTVQGWLSAHVYLGTVLVVLATLHTGFEFGWNVHTLAYALTLAVVLSGFWGLFFYLRNPERMNRALLGETVEQHLLAITAIDNDCRTLAMNHVDTVNRALLDSLGAPLFDNLWQRLAGRNRQCRTAAVVQLLDGGVGELTAEQVRVNAEVYRLQLQKLARLNRLRSYLGHKTWLDAWLLLHVPLAIALLGALAAHIVSVFYYW